MAAMVRARDCAKMVARSARILRTTSPPLGLGGAPLGQRCASTTARHGKRSTGLEEVQRLLYQAEERYKPDGGVEPIPTVSLEQVKISYNNSGSGGQSFNKVVNTKVDMRFNVKTALWLDEKVRDRIMQMEKNRINKDGDIVISSKKSKSHRSNTDDAIAKLQAFAYQKKKLQAIIDAASYAPVPPSEETVQKIAELSTLSEQKRLGKKKAQSRTSGSTSSRGSTSTSSRTSSSASNKQYCSMTIKTISFG